jgi:MFS family permease
MNPLARRIQRTYLILMLGNTLAGSFIWGINTLFLLDAGLSNLEAFAANAFFAAGMVVFEVPTGVVADTWGRRTSYLMGTVTLAATTLLYWLMWRLHAAFWSWAVVSAALGLGFTFFSGAMQAWLVDAMRSAGYDGALDDVLGRGQMVSGAAMLGGSIAGGVIAQVTNLGVPYLIRAGVLLVMFVVAFALMKDLGFVADPKHPLRAMRSVLKASIEHGLRNRPVRWVMLAAPFASGAGFYAFYAAQPYLLKLHGHGSSYAIAGLAAGLVAGTQIVGGWAAPRIRRLFEKRTTALIIACGASSLVLVALGLTSALWFAVVLIAIWGMTFAAETPIRQAYLNDMTPSKQRATILSFASLMESSGGAVIQPALGKSADVYGYAPSFVFSGIVALGALPFLFASRRERADADVQGREHRTGSESREGASSEDSER